jgi:hypothetical protein
VKHGKIANGIIVFCSKLLLGVGNWPAATGQNKQIEQYQYASLDCPTLPSIYGLSSLSWSYASTLITEEVPKDARRFVDQLGKKWLKNLGKNESMFEWVVEKEQRIDLI